MLRRDDYFEKSVRSKRARKKKCSKREGPNVPIECGNVGTNFCFGKIFMR